ncbi:MAG: hypothetical protein USCAAHI_02837 [Beijerinckiaceae bacterium]|nr:MAG: hypothetical protein USCAAHI_02837 [Beijerinckiaceae bacterium]
MRADFSLKLKIVGNAVHEDKCTREKIQQKLGGMR